MIDCCNTSSISPIVVLDSYLTWTAPSSPFSAIRRKPQSDTIRVIAGSVPTIHCCAWRPTLPTFGMRNCVLATLELGMELPNCWILVSQMYHPMLARFDCERIPVLVSILYCRLWRRHPLITLWSP